MAEGDSINRVLARNLAYWMREAKLTQATLALRAHVDQKTISNYLNPDQRVKGSTGKEPSAKLTELAKIADALGIGTWQLLREMTESERAFYTQIEASFAKVREDAIAAERRAAEAEAAANDRALRDAQQPLKVPRPNGGGRKKAA
jgi:transcriptional regulator with XRE-family HTH domain